MKMFVLFFVLITLRCVAVAESTIPSCWYKEQGGTMKHVLRVNLLKIFGMCGVTQTLAGSISTHA